MINTYLAWVKHISFRRDFHNKSYHQDKVLLCPNLNRTRRKMRHLRMVLIRLYMDTFQVSLKFNKVEKLASSEIYLHVYGRIEKMWDLIAILDNPAEQLPLYFVIWNFSKIFYRSFSFEIWVNFHINNLNFNTVPSSKSLWRYFGIVR